LSKLREKWTRSDVRNSLILRFARVYHGDKFRFLTCSTNGDEKRTLRERKHYLFTVLRSRKAWSDLQYRATNTEEGNGVCHICLVCVDFIPQRLIQGIWGSHVWISLEKDIDGLLREMSLQNMHCSYSMSRGFMPDGSIEAIEALGRLYRGRLGVKAVEMLARRWRATDALYKTIRCCGSKDGWCSDLRSRIEYLGGRRLHE